VTAADLVFKYAGFSLLAEGVLRRPDRNYLDSAPDVAPRREWTRSGHGYLVQAGMIVNPLLEVTARWEQLFTRGETDPQLQRAKDEQGNQLGGGLNLYLNGHASKLQGDYFYIYSLDELDGRHLV
jgi:phosphate-selective porin OprO and OprP